MYSKNMQLKKKMEAIENQLFKAKRALAK